MCTLPCKVNFSAFPLLSQDALIQEVSEVIVPGTSCLCTAPLFSERLATGCNQCLQYKLWICFTGSVMGHSWQWKRLLRDLLMSVHITLILSKVYQHWGKGVQLQICRLSFRLSDRHPWLSHSSLQGREGRSKGRSLASLLLLHPLYLLVKLVKLADSYIADFEWHTMPGRCNHDSSILKSIY